MLEDVLLPRLHASCPFYTLCLLPVDRSDFLACNLNLVLTASPLSSGAMSATELGDVLKPLLLKDLRTNCRARNLNPGGSRESLCQRLKENMLDTQD